MGFHVCQYVTEHQLRELGLERYSLFSSGDVAMSFDSGRSWVMPDMAPLYVALGWVPPPEFIADVMNGTLTTGARRQTRGLNPVTPISIGYMQGPEADPLPLRMDGVLPAGFLQALEKRMDEAAKMGSGFDAFSGRRQTKGFSPGG